MWLHSVDIHGANFMFRERTSSSNVEPRKDPLPGSMLVGQCKAEDVPSHPIAHSFQPLLRGLEGPRGLLETSGREGRGARHICINVIHMSYTYKHKDR